MPVLEGAKFQTQYWYGQRAMRSSVRATLLLIGIIFTVVEGSTRQVIFSISVANMFYCFDINLLHRANHSYPFYRARRFTLNHHDLMTPKNQEHKLQKRFEDSLRTIDLYDSLSTKKQEPKLPKRFNVTLRDIVVYVSKPIFIL